MGVPGIKLGAAGREARMLPQCHAASRKCQYFGGRGSAWLSVEQLHAFSIGFIAMGNVAGDLLSGLTTIYCLLMVTRH